MGKKPKPGKRPERGRKQRGKHPTGDEALRLEARVLNLTDTAIAKLNAFLIQAGNAKGVEGKIPGLIKQKKVDELNRQKNLKEWLGFYLRAQKAALEQWVASEELNNIAKRLGQRVNEKYLLEHSFAIAIKREQVDALQKMFDSVRKGRSITMNHIVKYNEALEKLHKLERIPRT